MFIPQQQAELESWVSIAGVDTALFDFIYSPQELRVTYKPAQFYFRIAIPPPAVGSDKKPPPVYVLYTPDNRSFVAKPDRILRYPAEDWEQVEQLFKSWLHWVLKAFNHPTNFTYSLSRVSDALVRVYENDRKQAITSIKAEARPPSALTHLHPTIQHVAGKLFADGHRPQAIQSACTALEKAIQQRGGQLPSTTGTTLIGKVFPKDNPLLSLSDDQGEREGYGFLYRGLLQAIRNHYSHNLTQIPAPRALEWLSFISALFHKLDEAQPLGVLPAP